MDNLNDIKTAISVATKNIKKKTAEEIETLACAWMKKTGINAANGEIFVQQVPGFRGIRISFQKRVESVEITDEEFARGLEETFELMYDFMKIDRDLTTPQAVYSLNADMENRFKDIADLLNNDAAHYVKTLAQFIEQKEKNEKSDS